jgi:hypothetical protein
MATRSAPGREDLLQPRLICFIISDNTTWRRTPSATQAKPQVKPDESTKQC